jgi:hypothetical protein
MNRFRKLLNGSLVLSGGFTLFGNVAFGQSTSPVSSSAPTLAQTVFQEQQTLGQEEQLLFSQGATPAQLAAWRVQNASSFLTLQANAAILGAQNEVQPFPLVMDITVPAGASTEMSEFLTVCADMTNDFVQIHNQQIQAIPASVIQSLAQSPAAMAIVLGVEQSENTTFERLDALLLKAQQGRAQDLASPPAALLLPPALLIPASATPQMAAFLTLRDQIERSQVAIWNANISGGQANVNAALFQWEQQNAASVAELAELAQAISTQD